MDYNTFNYWYTHYKLYYKYPPPSLEHLYRHYYGYRPNVPYFIPLNKKYGLQKKDDCPDGMKCTNVYCIFFHHPSADCKIFLNK